MTPRTIGILCSVALLGCLSSNAQTTAPNGPPSTSRSCSIDRSLPTPGEAALARKDYKAAAEFYHSAVDHDPKSDEAHLGLTRALIGQDDTTAALAEAGVMLARNPKSVLAEIATADAMYRNADFDGALLHLQAARVDDPCEGRMFAASARILSIQAYFAKAAAQLRNAHLVRPNDELIRREWIDSLPRKQRLVELTKYLASQPELSNKDSLGYANEEQHLKARRPGECRVTSKTESVRVPFQPIVGDNTNLQPKAYGLDVTFNGKRRRMQIDSGASGIALSKSAARTLNLEPEFRVKTGGVGDDGDMDSYLAHVASIRIGDVEVSDCIVEVLAKSKLDVDGLIGVDVFDRWLVTLDYQNAQLMLAPLPLRPGSAPAALNSLAAGAPEAADDADRVPADRYIAPGMEDWLHIVRIDHELLLPAKSCNGPPCFLMADTGAGQSILSLAAAHQAGKVHQDDSIEFSGISGKVKKIYRIDNAGLIFGRFQVPPASYFAFDLNYVSHATGTEVSGFIGLPTLSRLTITIDYRDNLVKMTYDPKHDVQRF